MHRIQVQLTERQEQALREMSRLRKTSISALVREGVDHLIAPRATQRGELEARALAIAGKYRSGVSDISERHDYYFAGAIAESHRKH